MASRRAWRRRYPQYQVLKIPVLCTVITVATFFFCNFSFSISFQNRIGSELSPLSKLRLDFTYTDQVLNACKDIDPCITIHVFGYCRLDATRNLLKMLSEANYSTYFHAIPLIIHLDRPIEEGITEKVLQDTETIVDHVKDMSWPHGPKILDLKRHHHGLKRSWLSAWPYPRSNDIMIAFEDDMVLSPEYFVWLMKVFEEYKLWKAPTRDPLLLGISLAPVLIDEVGDPPHKWEPYEEMPPERYPLYLHGLPSSWGAVYFGNQWKEFLRFVDVRGRSPFFSNVDDSNRKKGESDDRQDDPNLWLPQSKTNLWRNSWKRFMIDFAYGRGCYMLHPNMGPSLGLATSTFLAGEHFGDGSSKNPRQGTLVNRTQLRLELPFPPYMDLPLVDIYSRAIDSIIMAQKGDRFVRRISALSPSHSVLASLWSRPCVLDQKHAPTQKFPLGGQSKMLLVIPEGNIHQQMLTLTCGSIIATTLERSLVMPPVQVHGLNHSDPKGGRWTPLASLIDPVQLQAIFTTLDIVYLSMNDLFQWDPARISVFDSRIENENVFISSAGWGDVPRFLWNSTSRHMPPLWNERHVYAAFGTCSDDMLVLSKLPVSLITELKKSETFDRINRALMTLTDQLP